MAHASECNSIWCVIVPADGTRAATIRNGDFGTSPFFGQLADKLLLALACACGVWSVNHNSGVEKLCVEHLQGLRRGPRVMSYGADPVASTVSIGVVVRSRTRHPHIAEFILHQLLHLSF